MNKALADLIKISNTTGRDSSLIQGGGGNTSVKTADGKYMYIKASGTALKDMNARAGWRKLRLSVVLEVIRDKNLSKLPAHTREPKVTNRLLLACDDEVKSIARPSVEAHMHALLDKCVIHLHPLVVAAYVNSKNGKRKLDKLFRNQKYPPLWVPYADPGFMLAKKVANLVSKYQSQFSKKPSIIFLEKHGLIATAKTADAALRLVLKVIKVCGSKLTLPKAQKTKPPTQQKIIDAKLAVRKAVFDATGKLLPITYATNKTITAFMSRRDVAKLLNTTALNPDELLYANGPAMWLERPDAKTISRKLTSLVNKNQKPSSAFLIKNIGLFVAADSKTAAIITEITTGSLQVRTYAAGLGGTLALTKRQQDFVNSWESEAFRKQLASGSVPGLLQDRIAVVTGAGSGLGKSIALGLARAGAMVALADIDKKAAETTAASIKKEILNAPTCVITCDVTNEASVNNAFDKLLNNWGGLDILINAAGIAPPYGLIDIPADKWRSALEVNLTGYFLMAKAAAKIMIRQQTGGNIINLSSKSGLEASRDNTAYTATKAAEIHIARGWALELGEYGIRVNSVAPGNVFEGSKIWNPQYIKVCAKKYGIKPEQVIPYYVSKTSLKREIKGKDVADSVVFLCSDKARTITGQIIVPDSGQVMVR